MQTVLHKTLLACLIAAATSLPSLTASAESAAPVEAISSQQQYYSIPAGNLTDALLKFATTANITVQFDSSLSKDISTNGLQGYYAINTALSILLNKSDLTASEKETGVYTLQTSDTMLLDALQVEGTSINNSPLITNSSSTGRLVTIDKAQLDRIQPSDLKDITRNESSISVGGSIPMNQKLYLRGIEETALAVNIDGARQNNKVFHHSATTLIDPALLKSVTASAGISPADDGPGAIGGSLNFETVDVADVLEENENIGGFGKISYDTNSKAFTTAASVYGQQQGFEALAFINKVSGDDYKDGHGDTVNYTEPDLLSGLAKVAYEADSGDRFELSYETVNDDAARPYRANFAALLVGAPQPASRNYDLHRKNIVFNYSNQTDSGWWNPKLVIANSESNLETSEHPLANPNQTIVYTGITKSKSATLENIFFTEWAELTTGLDYYKDSAKFEFLGDPDNIEKVENRGVFIQARQSLLDDSLRLSYGARFDSQDFTGIDKSKLDASGLSENIFAEYDVNQYITINAGAAHVWGGIALAENFILNPSWDYSQGINSIESNNLVIGLKGNINGFNYGISRYKTDINNGRTPSWGGGPSTVSDFNIEGYDVFFGFQHNQDEINIKYSNIKGKKEGTYASSYDGSYFTSPLGELISINGIKTIESLDLVLGASVEISLDNDSIKSSSQQQQEGYTVANVFADYEASQNLNLRLEVNNLTDQAYTDRASYGQEFATVKTLLEQGRSFLFSARYTF